MQSLYILIALLLLQISAFSATPQERKQHWLAQRKLVQSRVETIENDSIQMELASAVRFVLMYEREAIQKLLVPEFPSYNPSPYFQERNSVSNEELLENYIKGQLLVAEELSADKATVRILDPFALSFPCRISWQEITFSNQSTSPVLSYLPTGLDPNKPTGIVVLKSEDNFFKLPWSETLQIDYSKQDKRPFPTQIKAEIEANLPADIYQFHFKKSDVGKLQTQNDIQVKLLNMEGAYADIELTAPTGFNRRISSWVAMDARDKSSKFLYTARTTPNFSYYADEYHELYEQLTAQTDYTPAFQRDFLQKYNALVLREAQEMPDDTKHYRYFQFEGEVEDVIVTVVDYSNVETIKQEVSYPIIKNETERLTDLPTTASVYDWLTAHLLGNKNELSKRKLKSIIRVKQQIYQSGERYVHFEYPYLLSTSFFRQAERYELKEIEFLNENKEAIDIDSFKTLFGGNDLYTFYKGFEYVPSKFPETPHYAKGVMEVKLAKIKKKTYKVDKLPAGLKIMDNALYINPDAFDTKYEVAVKDSTHQYLKQITEYRGVNSHQNEDYQLVNYYYGTPHTVEVYQMTGTKKAEYKFDLKLKQETEFDFWDRGSPFFWW
ncbi:MAG: hypothetical protein ACK5LR_04825 [Mangrovibacterium sp.]